MKNASLAILSTTLLIVSCAAPVQTRRNDGLSPSDPHTRRDSTIFLRQILPRDSVVLRRGEATIILSMQDVSHYFTEWPLPPDMAQLYDEIRRDFERAGWVHLQEGMLEDLLASRLIGEGRASIRMSSSRRMLPWVRAELEQRIVGTTVIADRLIYHPNGKLLLRVPYGVTIS